jgi:alpha-glucosidase
MAETTDVKDPVAAASQRARGAGRSSLASLERPSDARITPGLSILRAKRGLDRAEAPCAKGEGTVLAPWLTRWLPSGIDVSAPMPSFALDDPSLARAQGEAVATADVRTGVRFGRTLDGRRLVEVSVDAGTTLHGVGMHAAGTDRSGRVYTCWNTDWPAYSDENPGLYQSHPFVFAVRPDGSAFGVLADTTWRCEVDLTDASTIRFRAEGTPFPVFVLEAESPAALSARIAELTGRTPLPPRWALGYHQCRWSYFPGGRALQIARQFRERHIPCDVMWFDIHYMQDYRIFSFHRDRFADPSKLNETLHEMGFKAVWMIDPAPKKMDEDPVYETGKAGDHFTLDANGEPFVGSVWAGPSCFPDFTRKQTREWWAGLYRDYMANGIDGVWNDMNEPSVFDSATKTMPEDCWHRGDDELPAAPHAAYHNVYGMLMVRASREGILKANPGKRPFVLTRSNYMGGHRYAATWTGDNSATWEDLAMSIPMVTAMSLSGQLMSGPDIGGFMDNTDGDAELFARWMGIGCLLPFARAHVAEGSIDKEPWSFGPECEATCRRAIEMRYRLLPYLYTAAHCAHVSGAPIAAPAFFADPTDAALRSEDRAFLIGDDVLAVCDVLPKSQRASGRPVAMPAGPWKRFTVVESDAELPELYLKPGRAIALDPIVQHTGETPSGPRTVVANPDAEGRAEGLLYEDEGDGFGHETGGYRLSRIVVIRAGAGDAHAKLETLEGDWRPPAERDIVVQTV